MTTPPKPDAREAMIAKYNEINLAWWNSPHSGPSMAEIAADFILTQTAARDRRIEELERALEQSTQLLEDAERYFCVDGSVRGSIRTQIVKNSAVLTPPAAAGTKENTSCGHSSQDSSSASSQHGSPSPSSPVGGASQSEPPEQAAGSEAVPLDRIASKNVTRVTIDALTPPPASAVSKWCYCINPDFQVNIGDDGIGCCAKCGNKCRPSLVSEVAADVAVCNHNQWDDSQTPSRCKVCGAAEFKPASGVEATYPPDRQLQTDMALKLLTEEMNDLCEPLNKVLDAAGVGGMVGNGHSYADAVAEIVKQRDEARKPSGVEATDAITGFGLANMMAQPDTDWSRRTHKRAIIDIGRKLRELDARTAKQPTPDRSGK